MRTSSKLSSFAIAAIVLMAAANASFAQANANETSGEVSHTAGAQGSGLALAMNTRQPVVRERAVSESSSASNAGEMRSISKPIVLSRSAFNTTKDSTQFVKFDANQFLGEQFKASIAPANNEAQGTDNGRRKFEFVPSRGQKLPDDKY